MKREINDMTITEIKNKLKSYGIDPPSITNATRNVLVKMLRQYEKSKHIYRLEEFSSGDEDNFSRKSKRDTEKRNSQSVFVTGQQKQNTDNYSEYTRAFSSFYNGSNKENFSSLIPNVNKSACYIPDAFKMPYLPTVEMSNNTGSSDDNFSIFSSGLLGNTCVNNICVQSTPIENNRNYNSNRQRNTFCQEISRPSPFSQMFHFFRHKGLYAALLIGLFSTVIYYNTDYSYRETGLKNLSHLLCLKKMAAGSCIEPYIEYDTERTLERFYKKLQYAAIEGYCKRDTFEAMALSQGDIVDFLKSEYELNDIEINRVIEGFKVIAVKHSNLSISVLADGRIMMRDPIFPNTCSFQKHISAIMTTITRFVIGFIVLASIHFSISYVLKWHRLCQLEFEQLLHGIVEIVHRNAILNPSMKYIPVIHVRNILFSPEDVTRKQKLWDRATEYIDSNECRIKKGRKMCNGVEQVAWSWLPTEPVPPRRKTWQGEAFVTTKGTINSPIVSPTQCLKIRHMFDPNKEDDSEDWVSGLKNAILERSEGVSIVHIGVDKKNPEGCVYVKCASAEDAGEAYRKMHGAWFDGKIISVKYLRLERYHEHFPQAVFMNQLLTPSNDLRSSVQQ